MCTIKRRRKREEEERGEMYIDGNIYLPKHKYPLHMGLVVSEIRVGLCREEEIALKNAVFWDVTPCGSCKKRRFEGS
jgi:hypothetical protein